MDKDSPDVHENNEEPHGYETNSHDAANVCNGFVAVEASGDGKSGCCQCSVGEDE